MRRSTPVAAAFVLLATLTGCGKDGQPGPGEPQNTSPEAQFTSQCNSLQCNFDETSTDADGTVVSWSWQFGDDGTSTQREPSHAYSAAGNYTVALTVTDNEGATSTVTKTVNPSAPPPQNAAPTAQWNEDCTFLECAFNDLSTDGDGTIVSWSWIFGDNGTSTAQEPTHTYAAAGTYNVTLTVTDDDGASASRTRAITVQARVVSSLLCADGTAPGGYVSCTLELLEPAGFEVEIVSTSCQAHGNIFRVTSPVTDTLTTDGCYATAGTKIVHAGPFITGTQIAADVTAPLLQNPPALRVSGTYPEWTLTYEDGMDTDFDDLVLILRALP